MLRVTIEDNGEGMSRKVQKNMFMKFYRDPSLVAGSEDAATVLAYTDSVVALVNNELVTLKGSGGLWVFNNLTVRLTRKSCGLLVEVEAPGQSLCEVRLQWKVPSKTSSVLLNDHWERTYGDVGWHPPKEAEAIPWYFMEYNGGNTTRSGRSGSEASHQRMFDTGCAGITCR